MTDSLENQSQDNLENSLEQIQTLLAKMRQVEELVHRQGGMQEDLPDNREHARLLAELQRRLDDLHPADIAYILEALPLDERRLVCKRRCGNSHGACPIASAR